ncbi:MAG TPA: flavodoxin domain-containing protein [Lacisediminihabitans sp.]|uniref:flavodoxin family protein n=1 Tax=Lacisediminihabitans sp. TaxID=2787631 RepID=UPI002ED7A118
MKAVVVYESMFGNTRSIAEAVAKGLSERATVTVVNVNEVAGIPGNIDLLVVGGPTHVHGMSSDRTRAGAVAQAGDPAKGLTLEPQAPGIGVRTWLKELTTVPPLVAAFDTRMGVPRVLSGAASAKIEHVLRGLGGRPIVEGASFTLAGNGSVDSEQLDRALVWGRELGIAASDAVVVAGGH